MIDKQMEKAVAVIEKDASPALVTAKNLQITSAKQMKDAAELLTRLNKYSDAMKTEKEKVTKPLNASLKVIREWFKPRESEMEEAIDIVRKKMSTYQLEADAKAKEQEKKLADRVERGTMKAETAVKKFDDIERPEERIDLGGASIEFRTQRKLKITNIQLVVHWLLNSGKQELIYVDEAELLRILKSGTKVPGAEIEEVKNVVNKR